MKARIFICMVLCLAFIATSACGENEKKKGKRQPRSKEKAELNMVEATGTISKMEKKSKKEGKTACVYTLEDTDGNKIKLPAPKADTGICLDDYLGMPVKVTGQGSESMKGDKKSVKIRKVTAVEKIGGGAEAGAVEEEMPDANTEDVGGEDAEW